MASAESRARWLQYVNRCFVEEDYEGALRTPSLPSSSSKSESEEGSPGDGAKTYDFPADAKWWLNLQPNSVRPNIYSLRQPNVLETDISVNPTVKHSGKKQFTEVNDTQIYPKDKSGSLWDAPWGTFPTCMENEQDVRLEALEAVFSDSLQKNPMNEDMGEFWYEDDHKLFSEMDTHLVGVKKTEPWWRTADLNELASFVSHKSLEHFENCDLPESRGKKTERFDHDKGLASLDHGAEKENSNHSDSMIRAPTSVSVIEGKGTPDAVGCSPCGSDSPLRNNDPSTTKSDEVGNLCTPNSDLSKAQLLEALCHSQTRAREAEKAAQQAYNEKEHVIKLFLRQASQLFAYKQWLQILQLETLCLQLKDNKNQPIYTCFPDFVPWVPSKGRQRRRKAARPKPGPPRYKVSKSARAFLLGLTLAGAGLLLGWTLGWLFPVL